MHTITTKIETWLLFALVALWSFVWDYNHIGDFQRDGKLKLLLAAAVLIAAVKVARAWHWSVALFYAYVAASWLHFCFCPWAFNVAGKQFLFDVKGHEEMASITALLLLCPIIARRLSRRTFETLTIAAATIHCLVGVLNLFGVYPLLPLTQKIDHNMTIGLLGQHTILGPFLVYGAALACLRAIDSKWDALSGYTARVSYGCLSVFMVYMTILTRSSMSYGALAVAAVALLLFYRGAVAALALMACSVAVLFLANRITDYTFHLSGRMEPWKDAISLWRLRPWFGFGIGGWEPVSLMIAETRKYPAPWTYLHSDPLQGLFELGRVGMGIVGIVLAVLLLRIFKAYSQRERQALTWVCALAVFGTDSCGNFVLHLVPHGPIFALAVFCLLRPDVRAYD